MKKFLKYTYTATLFNILLYSFIPVQEYFRLCQSCTYAKEWGKYPYEADLQINTEKLIFYFRYEKLTSKVCVHKAPR